LSFTFEKKMYCERNFPYEAECGCAYRSPDQSLMRWWPQDGTRHCLETDREDEKHPPIEFQPFFCSRYFSTKEKDKAAYWLGLEEGSYRYRVAFEQEKFDEDDARTMPIHCRTKSGFPAVSMCVSPQGIATVQQHDDLANLVDWFFTMKSWLMEENISVFWQPFWCMEDSCKVWVNTNEATEQMKQEAAFV